MKLHLILLASLFHLSNGFTVTITGELKDEPCSGDEYEEFESCVMGGVLAIDPGLANDLTGHLDGGGFMNLVGGGRKLPSTNDCNACTEQELGATGHFCYTYCRDHENGARRLSEEWAVFEDGAYEGNSEEATGIAKAIIHCLGDVSTNDPCLPDTVNMTLTVTL
jgi:hypothetical protein